MAEVWYAIVAVMLVAYFVLDGFDLGAGVLHLQLGRDETERETLHAAIAPVWDGNEVWLIAVGGALFAVFPRVLGASLSGLYLPIFMVLWSLLLRGMGIELRGQLPSPLWRRFWDVAFAVSSIVLCVLFGAALGNLVRGMPLDATGYFEEPLFTNFSAHAPVGILDWYTLLVAAFATLTLAAHGAVYVAWKTDGDLGERARRWARNAWLAVLPAWPVALYSSTVVNDRLFHAWSSRPLVWLGFVTALAGAAVAVVSVHRRRTRTAFYGSSAFIAGTLGGTAASLYPVLLRSLDDHFSLTVANSASASHGLVAALGWWLVGTPLVVGYFVIVYRAHRGKSH